MALLPFDKFKKLWQTWNLRGAVLFSLFLQIFLVSFGSSRKRRIPRTLTLFLWFAYLLADWVAAFAVGLISSGQDNDCPEKDSVNKDLAAFWAPFLLLHLGGPDNITAFSLEDNQLWSRHLFALVAQFLAVVYVFTQSAPNKFWIPTIILTVAGTIKYFERTCALNLASLTNFKKSLLPEPDAGPNYAQLMEEYSSIHAAHVPVNIRNEPETQISNEIDDAIEKLDELPIFKSAYDFYKTFRGLIVDDMFSFKDRDESRRFFFKRNCKDAFKVMEIELNFIYDALYTKSSMMHTKIWFLLRILCSALLVISFERFATHPGDIHRFDLAVSYTLLVGAVVLDFVGHFKLIFSDWTVVLCKIPILQPFIFKVHQKLSFAWRQRWCNKISRHSLMDRCLKQKSKWLLRLARWSRLDDLLYEWWYRENDKLEDPLKELIFDEIKEKARYATDVIAAEEIYASRGERTLLNYTCLYSSKSIMHSVSEAVEFDECLLLWHIATELCYYKSIDDGKKYDGTCVWIHGDKNRMMCKIMSEYMLYLVIMQPTLMSAVSGIVQIRFQDSCAEAEKFFQSQLPKLKSKSKCITLLAIRQFFRRCFRLTRPRGSSEPVGFDERIKAVKSLLEVNTVVKPANVKGDRSKSVLFDACMLAKELDELKSNERWEIMSKFWVELLCYAASHCRADSHAAQLSKGGELVTFVWLLMVHFGLGENFRVQVGHARAKLIVRN